MSGNYFCSELLPLQISKTIVNKGVNTFFRSYFTINFSPLNNFKIILTVSLLITLFDYEIDKCVKVYSVPCFTSDQSDAGQLDE